MSETNEEYHPVSCPSCASEKARAEQLLFNCQWLIDCIDRVCHALDPGYIGTWQDRANRVVEASEAISQNGKEVQMGCERYVGGIMFSETNDEIRCLCTFPRNDENMLCVERVRSLAYLGAAVVLQKRNRLEHPYLPYCLPEWIRNEIDRNLGLSNKPA